MKNAHLLSLIVLIVGGGFFVLAVTSTFTVSQLVRSRFDPFEMVFVGLLAGLVEIVIGYSSMVIFGGRLSLGLADSVSGLMGARQVIEVREEEPKDLGRKLMHRAYLAYVPLIVFLITLAFAWDFYSADSVHSGVARPLFHFFDVFSRPTNVNPILYSVVVIPYVVLFSFLAGIVPSICLPYFRKFKVTGVNSGPFPTTFLITVVGVVAGISVLFTLFGVFYEILFLNNLPIYYRYILLLSVGLSLYFGVGSYLGLQRAEEMVKEELLSRRWKRVVEGSVSVKSG